MPQELLLSPWAPSSLDDDVTENMFAFCLLCPLSLSHCPAGAIVAVYVICWLPYHARRLMYCYVPDDGWNDTLYDFYHYFYMVTNTLFYVSSAVTPVLYNAVSSSFRKLFLESLSSLCGEQHSIVPLPQEAPESPPSTYSFRLWGSPRNPSLGEIQV
ncbi:neurotensin receptor type 2 [Cricetulus griseus]|nr:neurotensin receptor type 2 [Cricetulus griseus]